MRMALLVLTLTLAGTLAFGGDELTIIDDFEGGLAWEAFPADGVSLDISLEANEGGHCLRLDYAFTGGGYAIARLATDLALPANYAIRYRLSGEGPPNHLEFKLVDPTGENVWWNVRRDLVWPTAWETFRLKKRQIEFAWGPQSGGEITQVGAIEFAVTAATGGSGTVWIDDLELVALPTAATVLPDLVAEAGSAAPGQGAERVLDDDPDTAWSPAAGDQEPAVGLDFGVLREYGGLVVDWLPGRPVPDYVVEAADDQGDWRALQTVTGSNGGRDYLYLPDSESRRLRLRLTGPQASRAAISALTLKPLAWSETRNAFFAAIAAEQPAGTMPRGFVGEQVYWTVVGVDADSEEGLLSEDGALEAGRGRFSVEPFLFVDGKLITWRDVVREQALVDRHLPLPSVTWFYDGPGRDDLRLRVHVVPWGAPEQSALLARYTVENLGDRERDIALYLAVRPFQVNPPSQFLNLAGGAAKIESVALIGDQVRLDGRTALVLASPAAKFGATTFFGGDIAADYLSHGQLPEAQTVVDPFGAASAAMAYPGALAAGAERTVDLVVSLHDRVPERVNPDVIAYAAAEGWRAWLDLVTLTGPPAAEETLETLKAQLGYILVNRSGAGIQPGTRSYNRSWIRDGALTSWAMLRMGLAEPVREFIEWFAPYQYENGKIPCVVDQRGADPVPEHDSSGEFIFLVTQYYRYTGDRELLQRMWPRVLAAVDYLDGLRQERRTDAYRTPAQNQFFGLLPPSISHEGYSAKPMHSYWDDFFALRGFRDAVTLAGVLGDQKQHERLAAILAEFETDLGASVARTMAVHDIDYVPGCADLGDFDPTSTTIAISPAEAGDILPPGALQRTFEGYYRFFVKRKAGAPWEAFTPYEVRNIGAFVQLGWRDQANELREWFLSYRRPPGWRQWAEVVHQDSRAALFIGDMPHTWVGSDFIRSTLDMFVFERAATSQSTMATTDTGENRELVLAAGLPANWLDDGGITVAGLPTPYGALNYTLRQDGEVVVMEIGEGLTVPVGGLVLRPPLPRGVKAVAINGEPVAAGPVVVRSLPARVTWQ